MATRTQRYPDGSAKAVVHDRITFHLRAGLRLATQAVAAAVGALFGTGTGDCNGTSPRVSA
jgi:hypothetical protein